MVPNLALEIFFRMTPICTLAYVSHNKTIKIIIFILRLIKWTIASLEDHSRYLKKNDTHIRLHNSQQYFDQALFASVIENLINSNVIVTNVDLIRLEP